MPYTVSPLTNAIKQSAKISNSIYEGRIILHEVLLPVLEGLAPDAVHVLLPIKLNWKLQSVIIRGRVLAFDSIQAQASTFTGLQLKLCIGYKEKLSPFSSMKLVTIEDTGQNTQAAIDLLANNIPSNNLVPTFPDTSVTGIFANNTIPAGIVSPAIGPANPPANRVAVIPFNIAINSNLTSYTGYNGSYGTGSIGQLLTDLATNPRADVNPAITARGAAAAAHANLCLSNEYEVYIVLANIIQITTANATGNTLLDNYRTMILNFIDCDSSTDYAGPNIQLAETGN